MADFSQLPSPVLSEIMKETIGISAFNYRNSYNFNYLQVCSSWRRIAINYYYDKVYYLASSDGNKAKTKSNFELVNSLGYAGYARWIKIRLFTSEQQVQFLNTYGTIFQADTNDWKRVKNFQYIYDNELSISNRTMYGNQIVNVQEKLVDFIGFITGNLPNVKDLGLVYFDITDVTNVATAMFLNAYGKQITSLLGWHISCFHDGFLFDNLTELELEVNPSAQQILPRIDYGKLKRLWLHNLPYTFKWNDLFADKGTTQFTFKLLGSLLLRFSDDHTDEELGEFLEDTQKDSKNYRFKAVFPELRRMTVAGTPSWFVSKRTKYEFSEHLGYLALIDAFGVLDMLKDINIKQQGICDVTYHDAECLEDPGFYQQTNRFFDVDCDFQYQTSCLRLLFDECTLDWSQTHWANLQKIHFLACDVDTLLSANRHCPDLKQLQIEKLSVELPISAVEAIFKSRFLDERHDEFSRSIGLASLVIEEIESDVMDTQDLATFIHLFLTCCKSLVYLNIDSGEWMNIEAFVDSHKEEYPHLGNFVVKYAYFYSCCTVVKVSNQPSTDATNPAPPLPA